MRTDGTRRGGGSGREPSYPGVLPAIGDKPGVSAAAAEGQHSDGSSFSSAAHQATRPAGLSAANWCSGDGHEADLRLVWKMWRVVVPAGLGSISVPCGAGREMNSDMLRVLSRPAPSAPSVSPCLRERGRILLVLRLPLSTMGMTLLAVQPIDRERRKTAATAMQKYNNRSYQAHQPARQPKQATKQARREKRRNRCSLSCIPAACPTKGNKKYSLRINLLSCPAPVRPPICPDRQTEGAAASSAGAVVPQGRGGQGRMRAAVAGIARHRPPQVAGWHSIRSFEDWLLLSGGVVVVVYRRWDYYAYRFAEASERGGGVFGADGSCRAPCCYDAWQLRPLAELSFKLLAGFR